MNVKFSQSDGAFGICIIVVFFMFCLGLWLGIFVEQQRQFNDNLPSLSCDELKQYIKDDHYYQKAVDNYIEHCSNKVTEDT